MGISLILMVKWCLLSRALVVPHLNKWWHCYCYLVGFLCVVFVVVLFFKNNWHIFSSLKSVEPSSLLWFISENQSYSSDGRNATLLISAPHLTTVCSKPLVPFRGLVPWAALNSATHNGESLLEFPHVQFWLPLAMTSCEINVSFLLCQDCWHAVVIVLLSYRSCWAELERLQLWWKNHGMSWNWGICARDFSAEALRVTCFALPGVRIISASFFIVKV